MGKIKYAVRAIRAGASGHLNQENASKHRVAAIRKIASGGLHVSPAVAEALFNCVRGGQKDRQLHVQLSDREFQVLQLIAGGQSMSDTASTLNLSPKTVSTHKTRILEKMGMSNQAEPIRYAIEHRLVDAGQASGNGCWARRFGCRDILL